MKLKQLSWLPAVIVMGIIYYFSSKPAVISSENSSWIANRILGVYENITSIQYPEVEKIEKLDYINHVVRKGAHFFEYAVLAFTIAFHFWLRNRKGVRFILLSVALTTMYAASDEFHQIFIAGRSGEIKDVLLDSSGAIAGAFFLSFIANLVTRKRKTPRR